ncbi:hypothetical protein EV426DRAFT_619043 [Tirmania nivea]|nr:hypothetical protein EV426DRAFT_619043 [Tirmania nivea]
MRNSATPVYSAVGTESSSIEFTAFKGINIQSSNDLIFGTAPAWASWDFNETPSLQATTSPISVHPSPDARYTFRQTYPARLAEGETDATTYRIGPQYAAPQSSVSPPPVKPTISTWLQVGKQIYRNYGRKSRNNPSKSFVCEDCSKVFTRNGDLRRHEYTKHHVQNTRHAHSGNKPARNLVRRCPCPRCPTTSRLDNLPKHVERRHREVWDAVQERNPHALWYENCVDYYRRHDQEHAEFYQWTSIARRRLDQ